MIVAWFWRFIGGTPNELINIIKKKFVFMQICKGKNLWEDINKLA